MYRLGHHRERERRLFVSVVKSVGGGELTITGNGVLVEGNVSCVTDLLNLGSG